MHMSPGLIAAAVALLFGITLTLSRRAFFRAGNDLRVRGSKRRLEEHEQRAVLIYIWCLLVLFVLAVYVLDVAGWLS